MATQSLKLVRKGSRYFITRWYDDKGTRHAKSFGKNRAVAQSRFSRFYSEWQGDRNVREGRCPEVLTVEACFERFDKHARTYYRRRDGSQTGEADNLRLAMREALTLFGGCKVADFGLTELERAREAMIASGLAISSINDRCHRIRRVFRWAARMKYIEPSQLAELTLLDPLKPGRTKARVTEPVMPVPIEFVRQTQEHLPPTVSAMIELQLLTGMRSGELIIMRPIDIDTSKRTWIYKPSRHKTEHIGRDRVIPLGPKARTALRPFLKRAVTEFCFSPRDAMRERWEAADTHRSNQAERTEDSWLSDRYTSKTYARAITRVCEKHGIPHWSPHRLRHSCLTNIRDSFGIESSQAVGGHSRIETTQVYAAASLEKAIRAMERVG